MLTIALAGNQNSGKTTLFNAMTGENQHVGNWPGVTVEQRYGQVQGRDDVRVVDLPGVYSLSPYSAEEIITRDYLTGGQAQVIINIVDATLLERSLYLTLQLLQLDLPVVVALNMMDEVRAQGDVIHVSKLSQRLGVPVVPICARKHEGIVSLLDAAEKQATRNIPPSFQMKLPALHRIEDWIRPYAGALLPVSYAAVKLMEGDELVRRRLSLPGYVQERIVQHIREAERVTGMEAMAMVADARYQCIQTILQDSVIRGQQGTTKTDRIDSLVSHPLLAIPIFLVVMTLVFYIPFGPAGQWLGDRLNGLMEAFIAWVGRGLSAVKVSAWLQSLVVDGVLAGVASVVALLPMVLLLFLCFTLLEDSGYMARVACMMDVPLRCLGLSGRSFIPLLLGFGCTVPAVMACRSVGTPGQRMRTMLLTPFMSCGAKATVYGMLVPVFFGKDAPLVMGWIYLGSILLAAVVGRWMGHRQDEQSFVMELPTYRLPTWRNVARIMRDRAGELLGRACSVVLLANMAVWFLSNFSGAMRPAAGEISLLDQAAHLLMPLFRPLGFDHPGALAALVSGLLAKEGIIGALTVAAGEAGLSAILPTKAAAGAFISFVALYSPCAAAISVIRREGGWKAAWVACMGQNILAWGVSFVVFRLLSMAGL